jgi:high-affinity nickel-transport protein
MGQMVRQSFTAMTPQERARVIAMYGSILGLHVLGFFIFFVFVVPSHYKGLGIGVSILAYTLGLRHAFDADHISAIESRGSARPMVSGASCTTSTSTRPAS